MPIGKPAPDGDGIVSASRRYSGRPDPLGAALMWDCPACGKKNEGRRPEVGCGHCGAGDPSKSQAGQSDAPKRMRMTPEALRRALQPPEEAPPSDVRPATREELREIAKHLRDPAASRRIVRVIEYLVKPGHNADDVLRRSLVGTIELAWGSITGTIVDSVDPHQEDCLRRAHLQPGVWISNPTVMEGAEAEQRSADLGRVRSYQEAVPEILAEFDAHHRQQQQTGGRILRVPLEESPMPDTGPAYSTEAFDLASAIWSLGQQAFADGGNRLAYTFALALSTIAEEADSDPDHFLSREQCLELANALMHRVPADWQQPVEPETPPTPLPARNEAIERVRQGSVPTAVFREPPKEQG